ncbi:helix-turn-helix domain-containing protein [Patescibacteria group bacterium]|nr:helix-turn-helix domain-containing protein [Patescibacteria group bacterium]
MSDYVLTQEERLLRMLRATPGAVTSRMLETALSPTSRVNSLAALRVAICRARKLLVPGESIVNHVKFGYELVRTPRA